MACQKPLTRRSGVSAPGRLDAPETSKCLASFMPVGDERSTVSPIPDVAAACFCSTLQSALPAGAIGRALHPNNCARHALGPGKIRMFRSSKFVAPLQSCSVSLCRTSRDNSAPISRTDWRGHHYIVQPRSSGDDTGPTDRARTIGRGGHSYAHSTFSQPTAIHGTFAAPRWWRGRFDLGHYAKRKVTCMTAPSRSALIARPLRSNTFSMGRFSERTSAMNSRSPASRPRVARWRINAEPMPRP